MDQWKKGLVGLAFVSTVAYSIVFQLRAQSIISFGSGDHSFDQPTDDYLHHPPQGALSLSVDGFNGNVSGIFRPQIMVEGIEEAAERKVRSNKSTYPPVAIFYHVFVSSESEKLQKRGIIILQNQLQQIRESFLGSYHLHQEQPVTIHYTTVGTRFNQSSLEEMMHRPREESIGKKGAHIPANLVTTATTEVGPNISNIHFEHLQHLEEGYEDTTIQQLYEFCKDHPDHRVVYMHNKGSYHSNRKQGYWRRHMTKAATSKECVQASHRDQHGGGESVEGCDACGLLWLPRPGLHLTGNIWNADCAYIQKLIPPVVFEAKMMNVTSHARQLVEEGVLQWDLVNPSHPWNLGVERYAMEHWIGSHPSLQACDVSVTTSIDFWQTTRPREVDVSAWIWSMFPRHPVDAPWSHGGIAEMEGILSNSTAREREYFLLPGQLLKWLMLYGEVPRAESWVWSWYPDGLKWQNLVEKYGIEALQVNFDRNNHYKA